MGNVEACTCFGMRKNVDKNAETVEAHDAQNEGGQADIETILIVKCDVNDKLALAVKKHLSGVMTEPFREFDIVDDDSSMHNLRLCYKAQLESGLEMGHTFYPETTSIKLCSYSEYTECSNLPPIVIMCGHGDQECIGTIPLNEVAKTLTSKMRGAEVAMVILIGCSVGSPRAGPFLMFSQCFSIGEGPVGISFTRRISFEEFRAGASIRAVPYFLHLMKANPNGNKRKCARHALGMAAALSEDSDPVAAFNDSDNVQNSFYFWFMFRESVSGDSESRRKLDEIINFHEWTCHLPKTFGPPEENCDENTVDDWYEQYHIQYVSQCWSEVVDWPKRTTIEDGAVFKNEWDIEKCKSVAREIAFGLECDEKAAMNALLCMRCKFKDDLKAKSFFDFCLLRRNENFYFSTEKILVTKKWEKVDNLMFLYEAKETVPFSRKTDLLGKNAYVGANKPHERLQSILNTQNSVDLSSLQSIGLNNRRLDSPKNFSMVDLKKVLDIMIQYATTNVEPKPNVYEVQKYELNGKPLRGDIQPFVSYSDDKIWQAVETRVLPKGDKHEDKTSEKVKKINKKTAIKEQGSGLERCRFVLRYYWEELRFHGLLYYTDIHHGDDYLRCKNFKPKTPVSQEDAKLLENAESLTDNDVDDLLKKNCSLYGDCVNYANTNDFHPFQFVGKLSVPMNKYTICICQEDCKQCDNCFVGSTS